MASDQNINAPNAPSDGDIQATKHLTPEEMKTAGDMARSMDIRNALAITSFGITAQREMSALADPILKMVATKDAGVAGDVLTGLLTEIKSFDTGMLADLKSGLHSLPVVGRLFNKLERFKSRHEKIATKIDRTTVALERSKSQLIRDVAALDKMYDRNSAYFRDMLTHIVAGEMKLQDSRKEHQGLSSKARDSGDPVELQRAADMDDAIARLERRVHDLKLAAMIALQRAPQIRLVQNANQALVEKLQSSVLMTIPLWRTSIAMAIALFNQKKASDIQREVTDATNKLLTSNSAMLKKNIAAVSVEMQRGIVSIDSLRVVNRELIDTIEASLRINEDGRTKRQQAEVELEQLQEELKSKLAEVKKNN